MFKSFFAAVLIALTSFLTSFFNLYTAVAATTPAGLTQKPPRLVLTLVIDQFRADYLTRFEKRFLPPKQANGDVGGFRYLMTQGAYYPFAQYDRLQCVTAAGHAEILTGSHSYQNGIPLNYWFENDEKVYCTQDNAQATVGGSNPIGMSPKNLIGTTVGDELKNAGYPSKVVSLSIKDRSAILLGGHRADIALWLDSKDYQWVTSTYYAPDKKLPPFVEEMNRELLPRIQNKIRWSVSGTAATGLTEGDSVDRAAVESSFYGLSLPHGTELTLRAAKRAFDHYKLGQNKATDLFAVSLSSHDYLGHQMGPNSRDMEEMTVDEDKKVAELLNYIRKKLPGGLKEVVIVLTADHGVANTPEYLAANKVDTGRIDQEKLTEALDHHLDEVYGKGKWVDWSYDLNFFLNRATIAEKKLSLAEVEAKAKEFLLPTAGVAFVITSTEVNERRIPPALLEKQILNTFNSKRNGNLVLIPKPYYILKGDTATHMTGYSYDRTVPLVIVGPRMKVGIYAQKAEVADIAPTLSFLLGILPPALSEGRVLSEALAP